MRSERYKTIRQLTKPSTAVCNLNVYTLFLLAEPKYSGCCRLAEILENVSRRQHQSFPFTGTIRAA